MADPDPEEPNPEQPAEPEPRLDPFELTQRARAAYGAGGRPALPRTARWPIFPFDPGGLEVTTVNDPVVPEPPREGERADGCSTCAREDDHYIWTDQRWRISMPEEPQSLPGVVIHPRDHLDFGDLTEEMGAEMGVLLVRSERAISSIDGVGRVHVYKWGDGGAHLHVFVVGRPRGMMQLRGMFLTTWMHILPPLPPEQWQAIRNQIGAHLGA